VEIGHTGPGFCFDNEAPRHHVYLEPYRLASRLVTNGEYLEFVEAGGYGDPRFWLAEGWTGEWPGIDSIRCTGGRVKSGRNSLWAGWSGSIRSDRWCMFRTTRPMPMRDGPMRVCRPKPSGNMPLLAFPSAVISRKAGSSIPYRLRRPD